jgi:hypothetical protein
VICVTPGVVWRVDYTSRVKNSCVNFIVRPHVQKNVGFSDAQVFNGMGIRCGIWVRSWRVHSGEPSVAGGCAVGLYCQSPENSCVDPWRRPTFKERGLHWDRGIQ